MPDLVMANWPLKLLALALAFAIWVSVTSEARIVKDFSIPLELQLSENRIHTSAPPNTITLRLRGPESLMRRLDPVPMVMRVNLLSAPEGEQEVRLVRDDLAGVPRGVEVDFIDPDRITIHLDERMRTDLPVDPTFLGQPPEGYSFYGARVTPEVLLVEGPRTQLESLELLRTNPIRLDNRTEPFMVRVAAVPEESNVRVLDPRPLEVYVDVDAAPVERTLENVPIVLRGGTGSESIAPKSIRVTLSGPPTLIESITSDQLRATADVSGLDRDGRAHDVPLRIDFVGIAFENLTRINVKPLGRRTVKITLDAPVN